jgi:hypothetical protein
VFGLSGPALAAAGGPLAGVGLPLPGGTKADVWGTALRAVYTLCPSV